MKPHPKVEELVTDITDSYDNVLSKIPYVDHLDTSRDGSFYWETYHIPHTPYRLYCNVEVQEDLGMIEISLTMEADPDYTNHDDFDDLEQDKFTYKFEASIERYEDMESDTERLEVWDNLDKGVKFQLELVKTRTQEILNKIEKELDNDTFIDVIEEHEWLMVDWVEIDTMIELSELTIVDIPNVLEAFKLDTDTRFLTDDIKEMFLF